MLNEGDRAPDFELKDSEGNIVKLSDFRDKKVVLYFYPKDNTPGCTIEACSFRDDLEQFKAKNAVVLGFSLDDGSSHKKFSEKHKLPFKLLCGTKEVAEKYGAYGNKGIFGMGIKRVTYVIDEKGNIMKAFPKVDVTVHSREILALLS
ncbi:MAG TPA: peroxiredoxin [Candidatus Nanoarchaeia archaeon]|nr:peroxiredoxin [Candidatus Nanoarchaeia archaeon]